MIDLWYLERQKQEKHISYSLVSLLGFRFYI